jgi:tRNA threonylcarbamoyladenosine biosynthesis protein TsaB
MKILALDLSTARGGLAFLDDSANFERHWPNDRRDSGAFFDNLVKVRKEFGPVDVVVVGLGPGSYAGTRIAISAAIGLQLASGAKLFGFPSICALETDQTDYCVIGDARRQSFFFARIHRNQLAEGPVLLSEGELHDKIELLGSTTPLFCSETLPQFLSAIVSYPSARLMAQLAREGNHGFVLSPLEPMYLREPHITAPNQHRTVGFSAAKD